MQYRNFFQWYKEACKENELKYPGDIYGPGIDSHLFKYFILQYLYKGPILASDYYKLEKVLSKYSKRYKKEKFYLKFLHKQYYPPQNKYGDVYYERKLNFTEFFTDKNASIKDSVFVEYCEDYLIEREIYTDPIGGCQIDLDYLKKILRKYSLRFKFEHYLYKLFKK